MADSTQRWVTQSLYDLETAKAMLDSGRYFYVLFCCQQAVEKMLKALIAKRTNALSPRLHNLMRLAEVGTLVVPEDIACLFRKLTDFYIVSRYPEELAQEEWAIDALQVQQIYAATKEAFTWLVSHL